MEGAGVEPDSIDGSSHEIALVCCQETPAFEVVLPLFERVYIGPFLSRAPVLYDLLE